MSPATLLAALGLLAAMGMYVVLTSVLQPGPAPDLLDTRLAHVQDGPASFDLEEAEMAAPFRDRVLRPILSRVARKLAAQQPAERLRSLQALLNQADRPFGLDAGGFLLMQMMAVPVGVALGFGLNAAVLNVSGATMFAAPVGLAIMLYFAPKSRVKSRVKKRAKQIQLDLPDAIDLLTISVEAGSSLDSALTRVTDKYHNALTHEFRRTLNEIRLGRPRIEAIEDLGRRNSVEPLKNLCSAIIQAEQLGVGTANVLRIQSEELRRKRRQRAEELGAKAPLKMLFPMVGCIFPCLFIVLLGPAVLNLALGQH